MEIPTLDKNKITYIYILIMDITFKFDGKKFQSINTKNEFLLIPITLLWV